MLKFRRALPATALVWIVLAPPVFADSIVPSSFTTTIAVGESVTITKTVTTTTDFTGSLDVFFLSDTTGSMGGSISNVRTNVSDIISSTLGLSSDTLFGVGEYRDIFDTFTWRINQDLTTEEADVIAGVNSWFAGGGGDFPEANLPALENVANNASWRDGARRFMFWIGDAPGHDPRDGSTEASATAALLSNGVEVFPLNIGSLDSSGQATRIANATGGTVFTGFSSDVSDLIRDSISTSISNFSVVSLDLFDLGPGLDVTFSPTSYVGSYDRSIDRTFTFDVTFTGMTPGVYDFNVRALVDGGVVATEIDSITVRGSDISAIPEPSSVALLGSGLVLALATLRRRAKSLMGQIY